MKQFISTLRLTLIVAAIVCAAQFAQASETPSQQENDDRIEASFKKTYVHRMYLKDDSIKIKSKDGAVTLSGTATSETNKNMAESAAEALPGVKSVINKIEIPGEQPAKDSDAWVVGRVKATLLFHRNVSAANTTVEAKNGTVTLRGVASSEAQKELTGEYAEDVEGVKDVKNEMTVAPPEEKLTDKVAEKTDKFADSIDDLSISVQAKFMLASHRSTSAVRTKVEVRDGAVTLRGTAKNAAEKDLVTKLVNDINGVTAVVNEMTIEATP